MGKLLSLVLGLAVVAFLAYRAMYMSSSKSGETRPQQQLQNAKDAAKRIEADQQQQADKAFNVPQE